MVACAAVVSGVVAWLFGGRLIKAAFLVIGGVVGAALGAVYFPVFTDSLGGIPAAYVGMGLGFIVGVIAAALLFRFAMAILAAGVIGTAAVLVAIVTLSHVPGAIPPTESIGVVDGRAVIIADGSGQTARRLVREQFDSWTGAAKAAASRSVMGTPPSSSPITGAVPGDRPHLSLDGSGSHGEPGDAVGAAAEAAEEAARAIYDLIARRWQALPDRSRWIVAGSWMAGAMAGFALGIILPRKAAAAVSSLAGAGMILAGGVWLADRYTGLGAWLAGVGALGYLGAWMVLSAVGLIFQSRSRLGAAPAGSASQRP